MDNIYWFTGKEDCINFFNKMAENNDEKLTSNFCIEGNSDTTFEWVMDVVKVVGWNNIGVLERDFKDEEITFCDEIFIRIKELEKFNKGYIDLCADEVSLESNDNGIYIRIWWD